MTGVATNVCVETTARQAFLRDYYVVFTSDCTATYSQPDHDATLRNIEGLVKLVDREEIKAHDWSLTPGRFVGVAPEEVDEDFDFEEALRSIHIDLKGLNEEAAELAARIAKNFEELGV